MIKYIEAYIKFRKGVVVKVRPPVDVREVELLNSAYLYARNFMKAVNLDLEV